MTDYAMMSRNVRAFMALVRCTKPVVCKVHGFCVAGGTDLALCADLLRGGRGHEDRLSAGPGLGLADDGAVGAPARAAAGQAAALHRRLADRRAGGRVGPGPGGVAGGRARASGSRRWSQRIAQIPLNQLQMMKLLCNQWIRGRRGWARARCWGRCWTGSPATRGRGMSSRRLAASRGLPRGGAPAR